MKMATPLSCGPHLKCSATHGWWLPGGWHPSGTVVTEDSPGGMAQTLTAHTQVAPHSWVSRRTHPLPLRGLAGAGPSVSAVPSTHASL